MNPRVGPSGPLAKAFTETLQLTCANGTTVNPGERLAFTGFPSESKLYEIDSANKRITIKAKGRYRMVLNILMASDNAAPVASINVYKNDEYLTGARGAKNEVKLTSLIQFQDLEFEADDTFSIGLASGAGDYLISNSNSSHVVLSLEKVA